MRRQLTSALRGHGTKNLDLQLGSVSPGTDCGVELIAPGSERVSNVRSRMGFGKSLSRFGADPRVLRGAFHCSLSTLHGQVIRVRSITSINHRFEFAPEKAPG